jgi:hypothetical protein
MLVKQSSLGTGQHTEARHLPAEVPTASTFLLFRHVSQGDHNERVIPLGEFRDQSICLDQVKRIIVINLGHNALLSGEPNNPRKPNLLDF